MNTQYSQCIYQYGYGVLQPKAASESISIVGPGGAISRKLHDFTLSKVENEPLITLIFNIDSHVQAVMQLAFFFK